jgi:hypothetical protein
MQVGVRSLLAAALVAWVASCSLNDHGLGSVGASKTGSAGAMGATGAAGALSGVAGNTGAGLEPAGNGGTTAVGGATGAAGEMTGTGGASAGTAGGAAGAAGGTAGAAGDGSGGATATGGSSGVSGTGGASANGGAGGGKAGAGGSSATAGNGGAGGGKAGTGGSGTAGSGAGGSSAAGSGAAGSGAAGSAAADPGCSDNTREGFQDTTLYPDIAACSGAWDTPGLGSLDSETPQCDRRAGNDGDKPDGRGCSVADLCESGWHVCYNAHEVYVDTMGAGCDDAVAPANGKSVFYVTRQHATGLVCEASENAAGTNNLYGCGNIGSSADKVSCTPFTRMLRDSDCVNNSPWMCSDGPNGTSQDEYDVVTKPGSSRGGVLCCRD